MSLPNYIQKIKSAGIYRFTFDKSVLPSNAAEVLRLVVGYSDKGPFNTLVYFDNPGDFTKVFGNPSKKLERNGVWFHRLALQALKRGPILALNLKKFGTETVEGVTFNPNEVIPTDMESFSIPEIYDTNRFWTIDPEHLEDIDWDHSTSGVQSGEYVKFAATDSKGSSCTIFMRGYQPQGYDVPVREWYQSVLNGQDIPPFFEGYEGTLVSQYFAEIYVFRGEFTPEIATSEALARYFDVDGTNVTLKPYVLNAFGEKVDTLAALASNDASNFINSYSGSLIPDFQASNGSVIALDALFNADYDTHKMVMRLDRNYIYDTPDAVKDIDTTGWLNGTTAATMMSVSTATPSVNMNTYDAAAEKWNNVGEYSNPNYIGFTFSNFDDTDAPTYTTTNKMDDIVIMIGDKFLATDGIATITDMKTEDGTTTIIFDKAVETTPSPAEAYKSYKTYDAQTAGDETGSGIVTYGNTFEVSSTEYTKLEVGGDDFAVLSSALSDLSTRALLYTYTVDETDPDNPVYAVTATNPASYIEITEHTAGEDGTAIYQCHSSVTAFTGNDNYTLAPTYIEGYTRDTDLEKPDGNTMKAKLDWQNSILSALTEYKGLLIGLTNNVDSEYRYIVDTFDSYVDNEMKGKLSSLAKMKDNSVLLANFPKMKTFERCDYVSFTDANNMLDTKYIAQGGNRQKPMALVFSLPTEENGASWSAFYTQVNIKDPSTAIKYTCPSAALVSNKFMDKIESRQPYNVVAGPDFSRLSENGLLGPDFNFSREDLNNLEPMGVNCLVSAPGKGTFINGNQSAKQNPVSTLSSINVRELVITVQDTIEDILQSHQWWTNDADLRARIKGKVDYMLDNVKDNKGIYDYNTICDESNNTDELISMGMFIIDVSIEPARGSGIMIQRLYLYRKGGIASESIQD